MPPHCAVAPPHGSQASRLHLPLRSLRLAKEKKDFILYFLEHRMLSPHAAVQGWAGTAEANSPRPPKQWCQTRSDARDPKKDNLMKITMLNFVLKQRWGAGWGSGVEVGTGRLAEAKDVKARKRTGKIWGAGEPFFGGRLFSFSDRKNRNFGEC